MKPSLFKFALVGGVGFVADAFVFSIVLYVLDAPLLFSRVIAFVCAATVTWIGNRYFTFSRCDRHSALKQWGKFLCGASVSAIPNFIVFQLIISLFGEAELAVYSALVCGILVGMSSNYLLSSHWVFNSAK